MARQIKGVAPNGTVSWEGEVSGNGAVRDLHGVVLPTAEEIFRFGMRPGAECLIQEATQALLYRLSAAFVWELVVAGPAVLSEHYDWRGKIETATEMPQDAPIDPCRYRVYNSQANPRTFITTAPPGVVLTVQIVDGMSFQHDSGPQSAGPPHQSRLRLDGEVAAVGNIDSNMTFIYGGDLYWYEIHRSTGQPG